MKLWKFSLRIDFDQHLGFGCTDKNFKLHLGMILGLGKVLVDFVKFRACFSLLEIKLVSCDFHKKISDSCFDDFIEFGFQYKWFAYVICVYGVPNVSWGSFQYLRLGCIFRFVGLTVAKVMSPKRRLLKWGRIHYCENRVLARSCVMPRACTLVTDTREPLLAPRESLAWLDLLTQRKTLNINKMI